MAFWFCREGGCTQGKQGGRYRIGFFEAIAAARAHAEREDRRRRGEIHEVSVRGERDVYTRNVKGVWSPPIREAGVQEAY